jgi:Holliday junction resolvasome RuvABC endonuclease subunit
MKLLALDMNTKATGSILFKDGELHNRVCMYAKDIDVMAVILEQHLNVFRPDVVATEAAYMGENAHSYGLLCEMIGMVRSWCARHDVFLIILTTSQIDKATGVRGDRKAGNRALAKHELETLLVATNITEHECDAYAVGIAAMGRVKVENWKAEGVTNA